MEETGPGAHVRACPHRALLDRFSDRWSLAVLADLDEPRRFAAIRRAVPGITQKVLTTTLRGLEHDGFVERRVLPTSPVGVEYRLTDLGRSLEEPFAALRAWTESHPSAASGFTAS